MAIKQKPFSGFSLPELLVVLGILCAVFGLLMFGVLNGTTGPEKARVAKAQTINTDLASAVLSIIGKDTLAIGEAESAPSQIVSNTLNITGIQTSTKYPGWSELETRGATVHVPGQSVFQGGWLYGAEPGKRSSQFSFFYEVDIANQVVQCNEIFDNGDTKMGQPGIDCNALISAITPMDTPAPVTIAYSTPSVGATLTPSLSLTISPSASPLPPTDTATNSPIPPTATATDSPTNTPTDTPSNTPTNTPTDTPTNTPSNTSILPSDSPTNSPSDTPTDTPSNTPMDTPIATDTPASSIVPTVFVPTNSPDPSISPTIGDPVYPFIFHQVDLLDDGPYVMQVNVYTTAFDATLTGTKQMPTDPDFQEISGSYSGSISDHTGGNAWDPSACNGWAALPLDATQTPRIIRYFAHYNSTTSNYTLSGCQVFDDGYGGGAQIN